MNQQGLIKTLKSCDLISKGLSKSELELLATYFQVCEYKPNECLMKEGEPATSLMILVSGEARAILSDLQLDIIHPKTIFGESMFSEDPNRIATITASKDSVVGIFDLESHQSLIKDYPMIAIQFSRIMLEELKQRKLYNNELFYDDSTQYLALIAHNEMKQSLVDFAKIYSEKIKRYPLVATGTTGQKLFNEVGLMLSRKVESGPLGGDQAVGTMISKGNISAVIFFRDPLSAHPHHADIEALGRLCDVYQIPFATNPATAVAVLNELEKVHDHSLDIENRVLDKYRNQQKKVVVNSRE